VEVSRLIAWAEQRDRLIVAGLGHFPMCGDPEHLLACLLPLPERIRTAGSTA
jgi:hypothetical protein